MYTSLTTSENIDLSRIIQEIEAGIDEPCSGSIVDYDEKKIYLIFDFDDSKLEPKNVTILRSTMTVEE